MEFLVNKENNTVTIEREFAAPLSRVWDAFTKQEILDQWWAPKPFESRTKIMNFEVGGRRFYAMVTPDGQEMWAIHKYTSITPKTNFKYLNAFADKEENPTLPGSDWDFNFTEQNGKTKVKITIYNESRERMEKMIEMGFKEGITATLNELEVLLTSPSQNKEVNMNKLHFSITINATKAKVWNTMLVYATYRVWTEAFNPGSHYVGDWSKGSKILFLGPDPATGKIGGMVSRIEENRLHEYISIEHLGMVNDGIEDTTSEMVKAFAGAHENYSFKENDKKTEVLVDIDSSGGEFEEMFKDMWPKALQKLKELAEK